MAHILEKATISHAPLSQSQTLQLFQYLQDQQTDTARQLQELKSSFDTAESSNERDRREQFLLVGTVQTLQKDLADAVEQIKVLDSHLSDCGRQIRWLQGENQRSADSIDQLREGQKVTNTNVHCLKADLASKAEDLKELQHIVDELHTVKHTGVEARVNDIELKVRQMAEDAKLQQTGLAEQALTLQGFQVQVVENRREIKASHAEVIENSKKIEDSCVKSEAVKNNLELTNGVVMKLHSDQEAADKSIRDLATDAHHLRGRVEKVIESSAGIASNLGKTREELVSTAAHASKTRDMVLQAAERIKVLQEDQAASRNAISNLEKGVESVHHLAAHTQDDLKVTNSYVLPNLGADGAIHTIVHGGTCGSGVSGLHSLNSTARSNDSTRLPGRAYHSGPNSPTRTPRIRKKDLAWHTRNIGSVPDRSAWV